MDRVHLEIVTDSPVYLPSQSIHGTMNMYCPLPVHIDGICARLQGVATVSFTSKEYYQFVKRHVYTDQSQELWHYSSISNLLGMDENANKECVPEFSGKASFPFHFQLPSDVATSFNCPGSPVSIKYNIEVRVSHDSSLVACHEHSLTVLAPQRIPRLPIQQKSTHSKHYRFPKERGIYLECILDRTVFTTTDRVEAQVNITNRWKQSLKYVHMSIERRIAADGILVGDVKVAHTQVVHIDTTGVGLPSEKPKVCVGESFSFRPSFNVPALPPSMEVPDIMHADYLLKIAVGRAHNYVVATLRIPITIVTDFLETRQNSPTQSDDILIDVSLPSQHIQPQAQWVDLLA